MQDIVKNYQNKINVFDYVKFEIEGHSYLINGKVGKSVTTLLKNYLKPFDRDYWADIKAKQQGITVESILSQWDFSSALSKVKGSVVHSFIESNFTNSEFIYPEDSIIKMFGYDAIQDSFNLITPVVNKFINDISEKMFPVASEFIVGDKDYLVGGTIDQLFYNKKSNQLEIWDWKTNKEIRTSSRYSHLAPLSHISDSELDHYSLQLSLYKVLLEKNTGLILGNSYLVWFNENCSDYSIFKAKDYSEEAKFILNYASEKS